MPLTEARQLPVGSQVDARAGKLKLITAAGVRGKTFRGDFDSGLFEVLQSLGRHVPRGQTTLKMLENTFKGAPSFSECTSVGKASAAAHKLSKRIINLLKGSAHGRFVTRGRFSAATVRGTVWGVQDRCDGTLTVVQRGTVLVTNFRTRKTVAVTTGHTLLVPAT